MTHRDRVRGRRGGDQAGIEARTPPDRRDRQQCAKAGAVPAAATPQEAQAHSWKPEYNAGRILAAKRSFDLAIPHFEKALALSGGGAGGARGVDAAMRENNDGLARTLGARASQYEAQAAKK